jgi:hypothetical protein
MREFFLALLFAPVWALLAPVVGATVLGAWLADLGHDLHAALYEEAIEFKIALL